MNIDLILMNEKMDNEFTSPVYGVKAVPVERIRANSYNPNVTAPPEMRLLELSIWEDGYTMPCVCYYIEKEDVYELVDGYHRYKVMMTSPRIYKRENGLLPVTVIRKDLAERMASTIRHNVPVECIRSSLITACRGTTSRACRIRGYAGTWVWTRMSCCA